MGIKLKRSRDRQGAVPRGAAKSGRRYATIKLQEKILLADEKLFQAEYLGSGTFKISKPKRKKAKVRQTALKNPRRGSRK
jgi:hypothetical protein